MGPKDVALNLVMPVVAGVVVLVLAWLAPPRSGAGVGGWGARRVWVGRMGTAVALGVAVVWASRRAAGMPPIPPRLGMGVVHWMVYIGAGAALVGVIVSARRWGWIGRLAMVSASGFGAGWLVVSPLMRSGYLSAREGWMWIAGLAAGAAWVWGAVEMLSRRKPGASAGLVVGAWCGVASPTLVMWASMVPSQPLGALAALGVAAGALALWGDRVTLEGGGAAVVGVVGSSLVGMGFLYGDEAPLWSLAVLCAAPWGWLVGELPRVRRLPRWGLVLVRVGAVGLMAGVALAIAMAHAPVDEYLDYL